MDGVVYIQPFFAPDRQRFERNKASLESLARYLAAYPHTVRVVLGGWGREPYIGELERIATERFPDAVIRRFDRNYGKAHVVNTLYDTVVKGRLPEARHLLLADSDMVFTTDVPNLFPRLLDAGERLTAHVRKPLGMMGLNQLDHCCHMPEIHDNRLAFVNRFGGEDVVVYPNSTSGVAGGCFFTTRQTWEIIGGYRHMGVYAGDDAYFLHDVGQKGFSYSVALTLAVIHPKEEDEAYAHWKLRACHRDTDGRIDKDHGGLVAEAEAFWDQRDALV